jgi:hypothetical protein
VAFWSPCTRGEAHDRGNAAAPRRALPGGRRPGADRLLPVRAADRGRPARPRAEVRRPGRTVHHRPAGRLDPGAAAARPGRPVRRRQLGEPHRDPQNRFEITVPDSWEAAPAAGDETVRFVDPAVTSTSALPHATLTVRAVTWTGDLASLQAAEGSDRTSAFLGPKPFRLDDGTPAVALGGGGPVGISMYKVVAVADGLAVVATTQVGSDVYDAYHYGDLADTTLHRMATSLIVTP